MRQGGSYIKENGKEPVLVERTGMDDQPQPQPQKKAGLKVVKNSDKSPVKDDAGDKEENKS